MDSVFHVARQMEDFGVKERINVSAGLFLKFISKLDNKFQLHQTTSHHCF